MQSVRIIELPPCTMAASAYGMFGDGKLEAFDAWFSAFDRGPFPKDYLSYDPKREAFRWYYLCEANTEVPEPFSLVDFPGGLYAVCTAIDGEDGGQAMEAIASFIEGSPHLVRDESRAALGNVITSPLGERALGYRQMDHYIPVKASE